MKGATCVTWGALALGLVLGPGPVRAGKVEVTQQDRVFRNFTREAATVGAGRIRVELRGRTFNDRDAELTPLGFPAADVERRLGTTITRFNGGTLDLLGSYGLGARGEVGFTIPFFFQQTEVEGRADINHQDVGDLVLYGKFVRDVAPRTTVGAGFELSVPTGVERKTFGTGELGFNPFLSVRRTFGRLALGAHVGYQIFTGVPDDVFNYSAEAVARASEQYGVRVEVSGRFFRTGGVDFHDAVVLPGVDFYLSDNIIIRPTGLAGITDEAIDWGVGVGIAVQL